MFDNKHSYLICGNSGVIGRRLSRQLGKVVDLKGLNSTNVDFSNFSDLNKYFEVNKKKYEGLIFLIGLAHFKGSKKEYDYFKKINLITLKNTLNILKKNNCLPNKIIFASTISIYGDSNDNGIYFEESKKKPESPYAITKLEAEKFLLKNFSERLWILRFAPVYSDSFKLNIDRRTKIGCFFFRVQNGLTKLSLCNIQNIEITIFGIIDDLVPPGIYNISDFYNYNYNDLLSFNSAKNILPIPKFFVMVIYQLAKIFKNIYFKENSIKLIKNNLYPSSKINNYIKLPFKLIN